MVEAPESLELLGVDDVLMVVSSAADDWEEALALGPEAATVTAAVSLPPPLPAPSPDDVALGPHAATSGSSKQHDMRLIRAIAVIAAAAAG